MLEIRDIHKEYRTGSLVQKALDGVSLSFRDSEFVAVLGPSGSGKTTLLNIIGGLDRYDIGEMVIDGVPTSRYRERDWDTYRNHSVGFIFQSYNLIPHQTLLRNVQLALTLTGVPSAERRRRAEEALEKVSLLEQAHKKPDQLSGGQMQRVAIARALVNNPSVVLADEPTGALDTDTGEQVMQLLKEVAKDRLVIMVTHNPDLAERYATRTVKVKDGRVTEDSDPYEPGKEDGESAAGKTRQKKPSMSFLTALSLSVSNLISKKARTLLVSFAASIGIIGIALILSLSNGANRYIHLKEEQALSEYPIQISSSSVSMESSMASFMAMASDSASGDEDGEVEEQQLLGSMFSGIGTNDLASLKRWFDSGYSGIEDLTRGVEYRYGISPQVYISEERGWRQVNPDQTWAAMGVQTDDSLTGLMSSWETNDAFLPMPENEALYRDSYTLRAGHWPEKDTDCVLVLTPSGGVPDMLLYTMGLKDAAELDRVIADVLAGRSTDTSLGESTAYAPEEFLGISFRLLPANERYEYDEKLGVWVDITSDPEALADRLERAEELRIVGVVQPMEGGSFGILQMGISYPPALLDRLIAGAAESGIVRAQLDSPDTDVTTGLAFGETAPDLDMMADMVTVHPEKIPEIVSFDASRLPELENDDTRLTMKRAVRIIRELRRTGESPTLKEMLTNMIPLLMNLFEFDEKRIGEVISMEMDEAHMQQMYMARGQADRASLEGNLIKFGYADEDEPSVVTIYPKDFESKEGVIALLDAYNTAMEESGEDERVISYTDYVGNLMSSVTTIIDVITYVLIAFVAVSLVVSSIMIGIITYISVLERRKEIGILRAVGASRRNIRQVFNAETFIIGVLSGAFGIGITLLLHIPINHLIHMYTDERGIAASLPPRAGIVLTLLCVALTLIGGLIPAGKAARQDPVEALRSE